MDLLASVLLLLFVPLVTQGQHYKANYLCDFENSDCGFHADPDTGAYFSRGIVDVGHRRTHGLVLGDLPKGMDKWKRSKVRTAAVRSPAIFPAWLFGKVSVSLDYFLEDRACVDYLQIGHTVDNETRVLVRAHSKSEWKTIKTVVEETDRPLQLVVEAHLHSSCKDRPNCKCSGAVVVDNLRISSSDMSTAGLDYSRQDAPATDPERTLVVMDAAFQDMRVHNRRSVDGEQEHEEELHFQRQEDPRFHDLEEEAEDLPVAQQQRVDHHHGKTIPDLWCPPPRCRIEVRYPDNCRLATSTKCYYLTQPRHCQCSYVHACAVFVCPEFLPCEPDPPCPVYPTLDPKTWDGKQYHREQIPHVV